MWVEPHWLHNLQRGEGCQWLAQRCRKIISLGQAPAVYTFARARVLLSSHWWKVSAVLQTRDRIPMLHALLCVVVFSWMVTFGPRCTRAREHSGYVHVGGVCLAMQPRPEAWQTASGNCNFAGKLASILSAEGQLLQKTIQWVGPERLISPRVPYC
jgi:hypothetical protein